MLSRLVYYSRQNPVRLSIREVSELIQRARVNNGAQGLSGGLLWSGRYFLQVLEGDRERVEKLYNVIRVDPRHQDVTLIEQSLVDERLFGEWYMAFCGLEERHGETLRRYCGAPQLDPSELRGADAVALVHEILLNNARVAADDTTLRAAMGVPALG